MLVRRLLADFTCGVSLSNDIIVGYAGSAGVFVNEVREIALVGSSGLSTPGQLLLMQSHRGGARC